MAELKNADNGGMETLSPEAITSIIAAVTGLIVAATKLVIEVRKAARSEESEPA